MEALWVGKFGVPLFEKKLLPVGPMKEADCAIDPLGSEHGLGLDEKLPKAGEELGQDESDGLPEEEREVRGDTDEAAHALGERVNEPNVDVVVEGARETELPLAIDALIENDTLVDEDITLDFDGRPEAVEISDSREVELPIKTLA